MHHAHIADWLRYVVLAPQGGTSKPSAGSKPSGGGVSTGGVGVGLEEDIKKLQRAQKFGKLSEADEKKLQGLQRKLDAQKEKQRLALDKVCMQTSLGMYVYSFSGRA